ncbi:hypothetical protein ACP3T3_18385 [Chryseobacterium sp. CBSDS_008]|uniref:hypothetical protein n=1 Tax=Chryseobacterium sp. CBSDS_008 TaxID=3415265 RepID=UPI003CF519FC
MKKLKKTEKKLSLNKVQMSKIRGGLNSMVNGIMLANGDNDTVVDKTLNDTIDITVKN